MHPRAWIINAGWSFWTSSRHKRFYEIIEHLENKANLRDLRAATGLVILLKLDSNRRFFSLCDREIWWMTSKNYRAHLLHYIKICASFQIHWRIQTGVTVRKRSIWVKIGNFLSCVTLKFHGWSWKAIRHLFYAALIFVQNFKAISEFKLKLQSGNAQFESKSAIYCPLWPWNLTDDLQKTIGQLFYVDSSFMHDFIAISKFKLKLQSGNSQFGSKSAIFVLCDLEIWRMTLKNNRAPLLCYFKLCASFHSHWWIQTGVTARKRPIWVKFDDFLSRVTLPEIWRMTLKNNRAPLLSNIKLYASFHHHMWIQTGITVRKRLSWVMTSVTLTFDPWPWPLAWTSLLSLVTPDNLVMIRWWEHSQQGKSEGFDSCDRPSNLKLDSNRQIFRPCDREIWWMTSKNNRALLLYHVKLCASFQIHWWIQTGFTAQKRSIRVEIGDMLSRVTLKFDGWPWKTTGHLFYATSSFVQHFIAIGEFKLELQSGNA